MTHPPVTASRQIRVFEPALCCNTGVCGVDVDQALVAFTADLDNLKSQGVDIARHNLANDPSAFASNPVVSSFLQVAGSAGLPLVLVDQVTAVAGRYPDLAELGRLAGLTPAQNECCSASDTTLDCCSDSTATGCCTTSPATDCCSEATVTPDGCCATSPAPQDQTDGCC